MTRMNTGARLLAAVPLVTAAAFIGSSAGGAGLSEVDPTVAPIPDYDYATTGQAFAVSLDLTSTTATATSVLVVDGPAYSYLGDPPMLRLRSITEDGNQTAEVDAWDPRWVFQETATGERLTIVDAVSATMSLPFDADLGSLAVEDQVAGSTLGVVDLRPGGARILHRQPDSAGLPVRGPRAHRCRHPWCGCRRARRHDVGHSVDRGREPRTGRSGGRDGQPERHDRPGSVGDADDRHLPAWGSGRG